LITHTCVRDLAVLEIREESLNIFGKSRTKREIGWRTQHLMEEAVQQVRINMDINEPENRI